MEQKKYYKNLVSIPRCGQHFTEDALRIYHDWLHEYFPYCEYYSCCKTRPCLKDNNAYQKNHEFTVIFNPEEKVIHSGEKIETDNKYLFLYRKNKFQEIESNFRLELKKLKKIQSSNEEIDYSNIEIKKLFKHFTNNWKKYYKSIREKYLNNKYDNVLCIEYEDYILNFEKNFEKILLFFDLPINHEFIKFTKEKVKPILRFKIDETNPYYKELYDLVEEIIYS